MNLFLSTRLLTDRREDHLTEFLAAALRVSEGFRRGFYEFAITEYAEQQKWGLSEIEEVQTQVHYQQTTCCPDMIFRLSNGKVVACENKLDALETLGPEQDQRLQLARYLDLPIDGLIYIRSSWKPPESKVLHHQKYIHPPDRQHFLWRDFYPLLKNSDHILTDWLSEGFERLGFTPPHPSVGEMSGPNAETNRENKVNFAKLWGRTRSLAHDLGWKVGSGSIVELYLTENDRSLASWIFISPAESDRFVFRVTPRGGNIQHVNEALSIACSSLSTITELVEREIPRKAGKERVIDVITSMREIIGTDAIQADEIETRLVSFLNPLLATLNDKR